MQKLINKYHQYSDLIFLILISAGFFLLMSFDINSWYYSAIGDEYSFYNFAKEIALGKIVNPFNQDGVYGMIPTLSSIYQAGVMKIFGINNAGWKTSMILIVIASFFPFYFLIKDLFDQKTALLSLLILASSHYLWAYIHTGYSNIEAIFPTIVSIYFFWTGIKNNKAIFFLFAGLFAALGFYTFYSSRVTIFILLSTSLCYLLYKQPLVKNKFWKLITAISLGFLLLFFPFLFTNKQRVVTEMFEESLVSSKEYRVVPKHILFFQNIPRNFFAFIHNDQTGPYVSGSLMDSLSGILFYLGFIITIINIKKSNSILLLNWFFWGFLATGVFSKFSSITISRLNYLLPITSIFAGISAIKILNLIKSKILNYMLFCFLILIIISLNVNKFYFQSPKIYQSSKEAVAIKAFKNVCFNKVTAIIDESPIPLLQPAIASYNFPNTPSLFQLDQAKIEDLLPYKCIISTSSNSPGMQVFINDLIKSNLFIFKTKVTDYSGNTEGIVYY